MSGEIKIEYSQYDTSLMDSLIHEGMFYHRGGRDKCPHCGFGGDTESHYRFFKLGNLVQIIWTPNRHSKRNSALLISHCPNRDCRKTSWEHVDLYLLHSYAKDGRIDVDPERVTKERTRRNLAVKKSWESSLCAICQNLEEVPAPWWSDWGDCTVCGTASAKMKCDKFVEIESKLELKRFDWRSWMIPTVKTFRTGRYYECPKCNDEFPNTAGSARKHAEKEIKKITKIQRRQCDFPFKIRWEMSKARDARAEERRKELHRSAK